MEKRLRCKNCKRVEWRWYRRLVDKVCPYRESVNKGQFACKKIDFYRLGYISPAVFPPHFPLQVKSKAKQSKTGKAKEKIGKAREG